jgi:purine nucleoside phosphorylase
VAVGAERRLAKVEATLGPKELVLRWLAEAHGYDDFVPYVRVMHALGCRTMIFTNAVGATT